jgi:oxygen-independent coproporphyrinogen III oxidase
MEITRDTVLSVYHSAYTSCMTLVAPWLDPCTAYVHIPFCAHHCGYCDFAVTVGQDHTIELYLDALEFELKQLGEPRSVETIFLGGGTPTHLSEPQLDRLLTMLCHWFPWPRGNEASIESTPDSLTANKCALLAQHGITRISLGVQSFNSHTLQSLDRAHKSDQIAAAAEAIRPHIPGLSLDLMFAAPGTTLEAWLADVQTALSWQPQHLSTYGLTYEKGTPLWKARQRGELNIVPEETELAMYEATIDTLTAHGFEHYEVSNFAKPGHRCKHNERYWANHAYYGVGTGAARYVCGSRELNVRNTTDYIRKLLAGDSPTYQVEVLDPIERAAETAAVQLRRAEGINLAQYSQQCGIGFDELFQQGSEPLLAQGLLQRDDESIRLTRQGFCVADGVVEHLLARQTTPS